MARSSEPSSGTYGYSPFVRTFELPKDVERITFGFEAKGGTGTLQVDQFQVNIASGAGDWSPVSPAGWAIPVFPGPLLDVPAGGSNTNQ